MEDSLMHMADLAHEPCSEEEDVALTSEESCQEDIIGAVDTELTIEEDVLPHKVCLEFQTVSGDDEIVEEEHDFIYTHDLVKNVGKEVESFVVSDLKGAQKVDEDTSVGTFLTKESFSDVPISCEAIKIDFEYLIQWILTLERNIHRLSHPCLLERWSYHEDINKRYEIHSVLYICLNSSMLETRTFG